MKKVKKALYIKDAQLFLDSCIKTKEPISMLALKKDGEKVRYDGWIVTSSWWRKGTHDILNPRSGQIRKVRDVLIFEINGHPVYL